MTPAVALRSKVAKCLMAVGISEHMLGTDAVVFAEVLDEVTTYLKHGKKAALTRYELRDLERVCSPLSLSSPVAGAVGVGSPPLGLQAPLVPEQVQAGCNGTKNL